MVNLVFFDEILLVGDCVLVVVDGYGFILVVVVCNLVCDVVVDMWLWVMLCWFYCYLCLGVLVVMELWVCWFLKGLVVFIGLCD